MVKALERTFSLGFTKKETLKVTRIKIVMLSITHTTINHVHIQFTSLLVVGKWSKYRGGFKKSRKRGPKNKEIVARAQEYIR